MSMLRMAMTPLLTGLDTAEADMPAVADSTTAGGTDFYIANSGNTIIFSED